MFNYSLGVEDSLKKIFAGILIGQIRRDNPKMLDIANTAKVCKSKFLATFPSNIFQDGYAIFYEIYVRFGMTLFNRDQMKSIIENNRDLILDSPYVNITKLAKIGDSDHQATDDEKIEAVQDNMVDILEELSNMYVTEDEWSSAVKVFVNDFRNRYTLETAQNMTRIMSADGYDEKIWGHRNMHYQGIDQMNQYYANRMKILNELNEEKQIRSVVIDSEWLAKDFESEKTEDKAAILRVGLDEIDNVMGDLRRGNMLGVLGPPKGGKTRFTNYLVARALRQGLNVCVWPLEGTKEEWLSMQTAALIRMDPQFNSSVNSKDILQRKYISSKDMKFATMVASAKTVLATGKHQGKLSFIEGVAYEEDFLQTLQSHYDNENPFDVIVIDSLVNIVSRNSGRSKSEVISRAYMSLKNYIANAMKRPALAIIPAQLKQDTVDFLRRNPDETIDVTAGGESAETIRTPDEVIGLFSSKDERNSGELKLYHVASRHSETFQDFLCRAEFGCCYFYSDASLNDGATPRKE